MALRHPERVALHRAGAATVAGFMSTLDGQGFVQVHTPKIVASATESGANVFAIDYFGRTAYLAQSPQFYKQMLVGVFERVYEPRDSRYSNSFDLLFRGLELATGGQRLHRHADYVAALAARGESAAAYHSYVDTFRFGMPPHGGFAIGLERFLARLVGAANVRTASLFPRDRDRLTP